MLNKFQAILLLVINSLLLGSLLPSFSYAQPEIMWSNTFGGAGVDNVESVIETDDGNFVLVNIGNLIKIDSDGNRLWSVGLSGTGKSVVQSADGGYVITGSVSDGSGGIDLMITKSSAEGEISWKTVLDLIDDEVGHDISSNADGEFIVTGRSHPYHSFTQSVLVASFDAEGGLLWKRKFSGGYIDNGKGIKILSDGNIIVTGSFVSNSEDAGDLLFLMLRAEGDTLWIKTYGGGGWDIGNKVIETADGGLLAVGSINLFGSRKQDLWIIKTDANGDSLWSRTFGGPSNESAYSVIESNIGGYIVVGDSGVGDHHAGGGDLWLLKIDENGNLLWSETFGDGGSDGGRSIFGTEDGGFVVSGFKSEAGNINAWILRFAPEQLIGLDENRSNIPSEILLSNNYPNPFNPTTTIEYSLSQSGNVSLTVYNLIGEEVALLYSGNMPAGNHKVIWDASSLASGLYIYRLQAGEIVRTKKMLLLK